MSVFELQPLLTCFENQQVQATFGSLFHSLGFITAVASAPEKIPAKEWMPQLVSPGSDDIDFEDASLIKTLNQGFVSWWHQCDIAFEQGQKLDLPAHVCLDTDSTPSSELTEFAKGYLGAYHWLSGSWERLIPVDHQEAIRSLAVLSAILGRFVDEQKTAQQEPHIFEQLPDPAQCFAALPTLISAVGMLGKDIRQNHADKPQVETDLKPFKNLLKGVGRNDPCPCGSGKKFKKCCLH